MTTTDELKLPAQEIVEPESVDELAGLVRESAENHQPVYPVGGGTSLEYGLPARQPGRVVRLNKLSRIVDYPSRDMTITVEAGITMSHLAEVLNEQGQQLPLDAAVPHQATLGGLLATNFSGPRRFGHGTARDYLIGVQAIDGRGLVFSGGGRVVKNVAGYDFCKLLVGSLGTLGIMTQVTLKVKPRPEKRCFVACQPRDLEDAEHILSALTTSQTYPSIVEWIGGPAWHHIEPIAKAKADWIIVGLEGTSVEVDWMTDQLVGEWRSLGVGTTETWTEAQAAQLDAQLVEFPARSDAALTIKASVTPSGTTPMIQAARHVDPNCSILAHAGNGVVIIRFDEFPADGLTRSLSAQLRPIAIAHQGQVTVLACPSGQELTHQSVWGGIEALPMMNRIKEQFDPRGILNTDRFVYA